MADPAASPVIPPEPRAYPGVNWVGVQTLYMKEIRRFWKVGMQTVIAPVINTLLYLMVFTVAASGARPPVHGVPFAIFIGPGLIMMSIMNAAFANSSSSLMQSKMMGLTQDFLTPPLTPTEQVWAFAAASATRGFFVGLITAASVFAFARYTIVHWWAVLYFGMGASLVMGMVGMVTGLWAEKWDHLAAVTNFVVMPMSFLSGTFYLVDRLPEPFRTASHYNPFFYMISGFRYGFIGQADGSLAVGIAVIAGLTVIMAGACWWLFQTGYRLKT